MKGWANHLLNTGITILKRRFISIAFLALSLSTAQADQCIDKAEDQASMTGCAARAYQKSDAELNKLFHEIRQRLADNVDAQHLLRGSERAWIAFRDSECSFAASEADGSSAYPMIYDMCLVDLTQKRIHEFRQYLNCEDGDMSCPVPSTD